MRDTMPTHMESNGLEKMRLDKWLWAARFYKTRSLATDHINNGHVQVNQQDVKPSREIKIGDMIALRQDDLLRTVTVRGLSHMRGPAAVAQLLHEETSDSIEARQKRLEQRRIAPEPAHSIEHGRPTKRDRRELERSKGWGDRWSASVDN